jgi:hypothetical protein
MIVSRPGNYMNLKPSVNLIFPLGKFYVIRSGKRLKFPVRETERPEGIAQQCGCNPIISCSLRHCDPEKETSNIIVD